MKNWYFRFHCFDREEAQGFTQLSLMKLSDSVENINVGTGPT